MKSKIIIALAILFSASTVISILLLYYIPSLYMKGPLLAPVIKVKATIVSLDLAESISKTDWCNGTCPRDTAVLRIDEIDRTRDPRHILNISVGEEVDALFTYSARPAKIRRGPSTEGMENTIENGYIIYNIGGTQDSETVLPGVSVDDQIEFVIFMLTRYPNFVDPRSSRKAITIDEYVRIKHSS